MGLAFEQYVPEAIRPAFVARVRTMATRLHVAADWLMAAMYCESEFKASAQNHYTGATGLIQFMPSTAKDLGTTTTALAGLSAVAQLDYVERYFLQFPQLLKAAKDWLSLYLIVLYPVAVGKPDSFVLGSQSGPATVARVAQQNAVYAKNGQVTVGSIRAHFEAKPGFVALKKKRVATGLLVFVVLGYFLWRYRRPLYGYLRSAY